MEPLTIEELKALEVGDWVWVIELDKSYSHYVQLREVDYKVYGEWLHGYKSYDFASYGKTWLAYKNKEQAECKGEIVELPCTLEQLEDVVKQSCNREGIAKHCPQRIATAIYRYLQSKAERRLAELKGE